MSHLNFPPKLCSNSIFKPVPPAGWNGARARYAIAKPLHIEDRGVVRRTYTSTNDRLLLCVLVVAKVAFSGHSDAVSTARLQCRVGRMLVCVVILSREVSDFLVTVGIFSVFCSDHHRNVLHLYLMVAFLVTLCTCLLWTLYPEHQYLQSNCIEVVTVNSSLFPRPTLFLCFLLFSLY